MDPELLTLPARTEGALVLLAVGWLIYGIVMGLRALNRAEAGEPDRVNDPVVRGLQIRDAKVSRSVRDDEPEPDVRRAARRMTPTGGRVAPKSGGSGR